jgi:hypothetical protein
MEKLFHPLNFLHSQNIQLININLRKFIFKNIDKFNMIFEFKIKNLISKKNIKMKYKNN